LIKSFDVVQITDPFFVNDQAASIVDGIDEVVDNDYSNYFTRYSNNNFVLLLTINVLRIAKLFGISNYAKFLVLFNAIMVDISILLTYLIVKREKNDKIATLALAISVLNPLNYFMIFWTYTVTYSLPFIMLIIYLWLLLKDSLSSKKKTVIVSLLFGIFGVLGYYMRPVIIIPFIAFLIIFLIELSKKKIGFKKCILPVSLIIVSGISTSFVLKVSFNKYISNQENTFPITHWIMMGLHGNGTLSSEDNAFTASFKTKDEMKKANIEEIKKTLSEYGISGLINHIIVKLPITWDDGTSNYTLRMRQEKNIGYLYQFVISDRNDFIMVYCQAFRIFTILMILFFLIKLYKKKEFDNINLYVLTFFGAILFYLLWEAKSSYSIPFVPIMLILGTYGVELFDKKIEKSSISKKNIFIIVVSITLILSISEYKSFTKDKIVTKDHCVYVANTSGRKYIDNVISDDNVIEQEFYSKNGFNRIALFAKKINNTNTRYKISLLLDDNIVYKTSITSNKVNEGNDFITLSLPDDLNIENNKKYIIRIEKNSDDKSKEDSIKWGYIQSKTMDNYKGVLKLNGKSQKNDLYMRVYKYSDSSVYFSSISYLVITLLFVGLEYLIYRKIK
ncbi:MAG: glycosyltransferase family 39 protein, partial [Bacilli bacterium]|nr:glycosyltransferase family 39 protein [Bacilli bacterium]